MPASQTVEYVLPRAGVSGAAVNSRLRGINSRFAGANSRLCPSRECARNPLLPQKNLPSHPADGRQIPDISGIMQQPPPRRDCNMLQIYHDIGRMVR